MRGLDALDRTGAKGRNRVVFETRSRDAERAAARASDPKVQALVDRVLRATFKADLTRLATFPTRLSTSTHYKAACDFAEQQLASLGYATSRQTITVNGKRSQNVLARRNGSGPASRGMVLVTAHLDSVNHEDGASAPAPGADDDASGSAGAIEIARALKDHTGRHDLRIVLFGGEEQGLFGSRHFVAAMPAKQRTKVRAVVQMDMIGTLNVPTPSVLLEGKKLSQSVIDGLAAAAATYTGLTVKTSLNAADSDHESFLDKGIPAVLTIEGADHSNHEIHTARDTLERINFDLALEILRMNTAFVADSLDRK
ncbi:MAG: M28 family metallopeptidase [Xanthobacteraceae bacterium]